MSDLHFRSASELTRALRCREISSVDLLEHFLARIPALNPRINAVVHVDAERARAGARAADAALARGESWGPLHGLPTTIKDSFEVAGMPCTSGAPELGKHVPERSATAAQRLIDAGAIVFGKTNLPLYAVRTGRPSRSLHSSPTCSAASAPLRAIDPQQLRP